MWPPWDVPSHLWVQPSHCCDPGKVNYLLRRGKDPKPHKFKQPPPQGMGGRARDEGMATSSPGLGGSWEHGTASVG